MLKGQPTRSDALGKHDALVDLDREWRDAVFSEGCARLAADQRPGHAAVDDKGGAQRRPEHHRLIKQCNHLTAGPHVVGTRLHRNQDQVGGQQC